MCGYKSGEWNNNLPVDPETNLIDVLGRWVGDYPLYIFTEIFGFCACGTPEDVLFHVRDALNHVANLKGKVWDDDDPTTYDDWENEGERIFTSSAQEYFMYYWLDERGLTDHGGSVPGWLSQKGCEVLARLQSLDPDNYEFPEL